MSRHKVLSQQMLSALFLTLAAGVETSVLCDWRFSFHNTAWPWGIAANSTLSVYDSSLEGRFHRGSVGWVKG